MRWLLILVLAFLVAFGIPWLQANADEPPAVQTVTVTNTVTGAQTYQHRSARWWAYRAVRNRREITRLKHTLLERPSVTEAIQLACVTYNVSCGLMRQLAWCESHYKPRAKNPTSTASGLLQLLYPSTWRTTPYRAFSVWSPYANAMAAAHMLAHGRRGEWVC